MLAGRWLKVPCILLGAMALAACGLDRSGLQDPAAVGVDAALPVAPVLPITDPGMRGDTAVLPGRTDSEDAAASTGESSRDAGLGDHAASSTDGTKNRDLGNDPRQDSAVSRPPVDAAPSPPVADAALPLPDLSVPDIAPPPPKRAAVITSDPSQGDNLLQARLKGLGFTPELVVIKDASAGNKLGDTVAGYAVVVVSSTVDSTLGIGAGLRLASVPVVTDELGTYAPLGLIANDTGSWEENRLLVLDSMPLGDSLTGNLQVTTSSATLSWCHPVASALRVAVSAGHPNDVYVALFDKGAALQGLKAPARRVTFFAHDRAVTVLTDTGWKLFDAVIRWATTAP